MLKLLAVVVLPVTVSLCGEGSELPELPPQEGPQTLYLSMENASNAARRCVLSYVFDAGREGRGGVVKDPASIMEPGESPWVAIAPPTEATKVAISYGCWHPDGPDLDAARHSDTYDLAILDGRSLSCAARYSVLETSPHISLSCWVGEP